MLQDEKGREVIEKTYEISYALFRVSSRFTERSLRNVFESQALALLKSAAMKDYSRVEKITVALEYLVQFGNDVGFIHKDNALVLGAELHTLTAILAEPDEAVAQAAVPLDDIFPKRTQPSPEVQRAEHREAVNQAVEVAQEQVEEDETEITGNAAMRQSAILERMRQSGNCRLKDIQEIFPGTSERTIRYDLQSLLEQNLIERIGNGGPSVYYRVRQAVG